MRWRFLLILMAVLVLAAPNAALACPMCRDSVGAPSSDSGEAEEDESANTPAAFNQSIYLMIAVPYLSLGVVIFLIYRGLKKNAEYLRVHGNAVADNAEIYRFVKR